MDNFWSTVIVVAVAVVGAWVILSHFPQHGVVVYNCSIAEISPDFPLEVREQCRKLNIEKK
jgi:hypothetical protein